MTCEAVAHILTLRWCPKRLTRFCSDIRAPFAAASPELRARQHPCRALDEDAFMTGHTFFRLLEKTPADGTAEQLRAHVMPLLRPSVQQIFENWNNPAPEPAEPLPTLLQSAPASGGVLTKLFQ